MEGLLLHYASIELPDPLVANTTTNFPSTQRPLPSGNWRGAFGINRLPAEFPPAHLEEWR